MWRLTPDFAIEDGYKEAFAPGYDIEEGFENPDQVVDDFRAMTYTSYDEAHGEATTSPRSCRSTSASSAPRPADGDLRRGGPDPRRRAVDRGLLGRPGVQTELIEDAGHAPQVEKPEEVAELLEEFSVDLEAPAPQRDRKRSRNRSKKNGSKN